MGQGAQWDQQQKVSREKIGTGKKLWGNGKGCESCQDMDGMVEPDWVEDREEQETQVKQLLEESQDVWEGESSHRQCPQFRQRDVWEGEEDKDEDETEQEERLQVDCEGQEECGREQKVEQGMQQKQLREEGQDVWKGEQ